MNTPLDSQKAAYGGRLGPPMIPHAHCGIPGVGIGRRPRKRRKVGMIDEEARQGKEKLLRLVSMHKGQPTQAEPPSCGILPGDFPPQLAFRALAAYSLLRTLSIPLRLSPFTPNAFLRALYLPYPSRLVGQVHVALLRILLPNLHMGYSYVQNGGTGQVAKKRHHDAIRWPLMAGDNLTYLDNTTWPLFYDDYCHLTADKIWAAINDKNLHLDYRNLGIQYSDMTGLRTGDDDEDEVQSEYDIDVDEVDVPPLPAPSKAPMHKKAIKLEGNRRLDLEKSNPHNDAIDTVITSRGGGRRARGSYTKTIESDASDKGDSDSEYHSASDQDVYSITPKNKTRKSTKKRKISQRDESGEGVYAGPKRTIEPISFQQSPPELTMSRFGLGISGGPVGLIEPAPQQFPLEVAMSFGSQALEGLTNPKEPIDQQSMPKPAVKHSGSKVLDVESLSPVPMSELQSNAATAAKLRAGPSSETWNYDAERYAESPPRSYIGCASKILELEEPGSSTSSAPRPLQPPASIVRKTSPSAHELHSSISLHQRESGNGLIASLNHHSTFKQDRDNGEALFKERSTSTVSQLPHSSSAAFDGDLGLPSFMPGSMPLGLGQSAYTPGFIGYQPFAPANQYSCFSMPFRPSLTSPYQVFSGAVGPMDGDGSSFLQHPPKQQKRPRGQSRKSEIDSAPLKRPRGRPKKNPSSDDPPKRPRGRPKKDSIENAPFKQPTEKRASLYPPQGQVPIIGNIVSIDSATVGTSRAGVAAFPRSSQEHVNPRKFVDSAGYAVTSENGSTVWAKLSDDATFQQSKSSETEVRPKKKPLEVSNHIVDSINDMISGCPDNSQEGSSTKDEQPKGYSYGEKLASLLDDDNWSHFRAIKSMRDGSPYYRLPVEQKLIMLEFLVDELLEMEAYAVEFSVRRSKHECSDYSYGPLPSLLELSNIENDDECAVCLGEGELLCCDGCACSYHRRCVDMPATQELPDGKWLCTECQLVDPLKAGPLHGRRKSELDWFTIDELPSRPPDRAPEVGSTSENWPKSQDSSLIVFNDVRDENNAADVTAVAQNADTENAIVKYGEPRHVSSKILEGTQFLVVHGFVFCRQLDDTASIFSGSPPTLLSDVQLRAYRERIGSSIHDLWPFSQVPTFISASDGYFPSAAQYFISVDSYDPSVYVNKYRNSPLPLLLKAGTKPEARSLVDSDFENRCAIIGTTAISEALTSDMSLDHIISGAIRTNPAIFEPYQMIRNYLLKLEGALNRSCLLSEFWESGNGIKTRGEIWSENVRKFGKRDSLSCVFTGMVCNTLAKSSIESVHFHPDKHHYLALPEDWSPEGELVKRRWERTSFSSIRSLFAREEHSLDTLVEDVSVEFAQSPTPIRSKRKQMKVSRPADSDASYEGNSPKPSGGEESFVSETADVDVPTKKEFRKVEAQRLFIEAPVDDGTDAGPSLSPNAPLEEDISVEGGVTPAPAIYQRGAKNLENLTKSKRRSGRLHTKHSSIHDHTYNSYIPDVDDHELPFPDRIIARRKRELAAEVDKFIRSPAPKSLIWPIAGRIPFETDGNLTPYQMRRLGRNAGSVKVPHVVYSTAHEVGQVCFADVWRKQTKCCVSFEELLLHIRIFESHLDRTAINSCESLARRSNAAKAQIQRKISCSQVDPSTGITHYFILHKSKMRGCWVSADSIELSPLLVELSWRRDQQIAVHKEKKRIRLEADAHRLKLKLAREASMKAKLQPPPQPSPQPPSQIQNVPTASTDPNGVGSNEFSQRILSKWTKKLRTVLGYHKGQVESLIRKCVLEGIHPIPEAQVEMLRRNNTNWLKSAAADLDGYLSLSEDQLRSFLTTAEKEVGYVGSNSGNGQPAAMARQDQKLRHVAAIGTLSNVACMKYGAARTQSPASQSSSPTFAGQQQAGGGNHPQYSSDAQINGHGSLPRSTSSDNHRESMRSGSKHKITSHRNSKVQTSGRNRTDNSMTLSMSGIAIAGSANQPMGTFQSPSAFLEGADRHQKQPMFDVSNSIDDDLDDFDLEPRPINNNFGSPSSISARAPSGPIDLSDDPEENIMPRPIEEMTKPTPYHSANDYSSRQRQLQSVQAKPLPPNDHQRQQPQHRQQAQPPRQYQREDKQIASHQRQQTQGYQQFQQTQSHQQFQKMQQQQQAQSNQRYQQTHQTRQEFQHPQIRSDQQFQQPQQVRIHQGFQRPQQTQTQQQFQQPQQQQYLTQSYQHLQPHQQRRDDSSAQQQQEHLRHLQQLLQSQNPHTVQKSSMPSQFSNKQFQSQPQPQMESFQGQFSIQSPQSQFLHQMQQQQQQQQQQQPIQYAEQNSNQGHYLQQQQQPLQSQSQQPVSLEQYQQLQEQFQKNNQQYF